LTVSLPLEKMFGIAKSNKAIEVTEWGESIVCVVIEFKPWIMRGSVFGTH
jgi:hypothetical protein